MMINGQKLRKDPRWRELVALYRYDWIAAAVFCSAKHLPGSRI